LPHIGLCQHRPICQKVYVHICAFRMGLQRSLFRIWTGQCGEALHSSLQASVAELRGLAFLSFSTTGDAIIFTSRRTYSVPQ